MEKQKQNQNPKYYTVNVRTKTIIIDPSVKLSRKKLEQANTEITMYVAAGYVIKHKANRVLSEELQKQNAMKEPELIQMLKDKGEKDLIKYYQEQKNNGVKYFVLRKDVLDQLWYKDTLSEIEQKFPDSLAEFKRIFASEGKKVAQAYYEEIKAKTPAKTKSEAKK